MVDILISAGYEEIQIPKIQYRKLFKNKVGIENTSMMFSVKDNSDRDLVLAPEYTAAIMELAKTTFKFQKDVKVFYVQECYRGEKPQFARLRQFTQLGVEIINPKKDYLEELITTASDLVKCFGIDGFEVSRNVTRGLDYYNLGLGWEISKTCENKKYQLIGGGNYKNGTGFALGIDRCLYL